ncbi:hypothetical protein SDC9_53739 [bioreactor metagenome]|uniref:MurNAc-LAA domain-containing protein n=1 Tax=bioreactor metagenome TaxID=1076179 RepID=A0A644WZG9_9ZZZZ
MKRTVNRLHSFNGLLLILVVLALPWCKSSSASLVGSNGNIKYEHQLTIILDDAHGNNVPGKCSPDLSHREWQWSQFYMMKLQEHLQSIGYTVIYNAPEETEPGLLVRVRRMNQVSSPAFVLSLHNNAAGMGDWMNAQGYSVWTTKGITRSDSCATILFNNLRLFIPDLKFRRDLTDGDPDYESNFTVLMSKHPSVLLEFMFQDNIEDLQLIENPQLCMTLLFIIDVSMLQIENYLVPKNQNQ